MVARPVAVNACLAAGAAIAASFPYCLELLHVGWMISAMPFRKQNALQKGCSRPTTCAGDTVDTLWSSASATVIKAGNDAQGQCAWDGM